MAATRPTLLAVSELLSGITPSYSSSGSLPPSALGFLAAPGKGLSAMEVFVQELVNSLSVASVIILIGIGVTLIFGLTGIINFAHGEFLMIGGIAVWVLVSHGVSFILALLAAVAIVGALGFVLE